MKKEREEIDRANERNLERERGERIEGRERESDRKKLRKGKNKNLKTLFYKDFRGY